MVTALATAVDKLVTVLGRAGYGRLSEDRGKRSDSIPNQKLEEQEYFERQGWPWEESLWFEDDDISASNFSTKERPGYLDLVAAIRAGRVVLVLVTEVSRLFRNLADAVELIHLAKTTGTFRYVETTAGARFDLTTSQGEHDLLEAVLDASRESGKISDRVKRNKRARAREGLWPGGMRPYGYQRVPEFDSRGEVINRGRLVEVPEEAAVIREVRTRLLNGEPLYRLVVELNARGVRTSTGKLWSTHRLRQVLQSPIIKGKRVHLGKEYPATWPAIIPEEDWERIQILLADPRRYLGIAGKSVRTYLLTGCVECGNPIADGKLCGAKLIGGAEQGKHESAPKRRYRCKSRDNRGVERGCGKLVRLAEPLELAVTEAVLAAYEDEDLAKLLAPDAPAELHELAASLAEDKERLGEASRDRYRRKGDPLRLEPGDYARIAGEIRDAMEATQRRMARLEQGQALAAIPPGMTLREAWDAADLGWRRTILSLVVAMVIVFPGAPGRRTWPAKDSPLFERAKALGGPWVFDPSKVDIEWKA